MTKEQIKIISKYFDPIPGLFIEMEDGVRSQSRRMDSYYDSKWAWDSAERLETGYRINLGFGSVKTQCDEIADFFEDCNEFFKKPVKRPDTVSIHNGQTFQSIWWDELAELTNEQIESLRLPPEELKELNRLLHGQLEKCE